MKSLGIVRKIDKLKRVAVPKEMRKILNLKEGDSLEFFADKDSIIIRKYNPSINYGK